MMNTKKSLLKKLLPVAVVGGALAVAGTASADWANGTVDTLRASRNSYEDGKTVVVLKGATCSTGDFYIASASSNKDTMVKLLIAAKLAGLPVGLGFTPASTGCEVYAVVLA